NFVAGPRRIDAAIAARFFDEGLDPGRVVALLDGSDPCPDRDDLLRMLLDRGVRYVQFYGQPTPDMVMSLRAAAATMIVPCSAEARRLPDACACWPVSWRLIDSPGPTGLGGTGRPVDWTALARLLPSHERQGSVRLMLAGGLTPSNVAQAIAYVR